MEKDSDKPFYGIWVNTWQYAMMRSAEETLINVLQGVTAEVLEIMRRYQSNLSGAMNRIGGLFGKIVKLGAKAAVSAAGADADIVDDLTDSKKQDGAVSFRSALSQAIAECLAEDAASGKHKKGFIFFIDDLDRLEPSTAVQILELLKNLFEVENCIFILAIDYEVVVKGLVPKFGPLTEKNEREFRSFFDKIIQLPFSMPVSNYKIDSYLEQSLLEIGYFTKEELAEPFGKEKDAILELVSEMVLFSTGSNPRSVKRLINSLSLIRIMYSITSDQKQLGVREKLLNFGFVCIQVAYPVIYDMLLFEPDYKKWNEKTARRFRASKLDDNIKEQLSEMEEFDEEWEQTLYRVCRNNSYLASRAYYIARLLNLLADHIGNDNDFGAEVSAIMSLGAVTTISSPAALAAKSGKRILLNNVDEYIATWKERGTPPDILAMIPVIIKHFEKQYGDLIRVELAPHGGVGFHVINSKTRERRLAKIDPKRDCLSIYTGKYGPFLIRSLDCGVAEGMPEDFYKKAWERFKSISEDKAPELIK